MYGCQFRIPAFLVPLVFSSVGEFHPRLPGYKIRYIGKATVNNLANKIQKSIHVSQHFDGFAICCVRAVHYMKF